MFGDIEEARSLGADGVVLGALTPDGAGQLHCDQVNAVHDAIASAGTREFTKQE